MNLIKLKRNSNKWDITKDFITKEYVENKKSIPQIAKELGMPYEILFWYKKKFGIPSYPRSFWLEGKRNSPKTEFKKGQTPWNKGVNRFGGGWPKGKKRSEEDKKRIAIATKKAMQRFDIKEKIKTTQFQKGIIPWNKNKTNIYSEETINHIKEARLKQILPKKDTNAEIILFNMLSELNVKFIKHKAIKAICQADAFIEPNIVLFVDGDYWHCNPKFYPEPKTLAQIKNTKRDRIANDKLIKEGYIVIRFWEFDLVNNKENCKEIIKKNIKNN